MVGVDKRFANATAERLRQFGINNQFRGKRGPADVLAKSSQRT